AGHGAVLEVAAHGGQDLVVPRVQAVEDRLGELVRAVQAVEEAGEGPRLLEVADGIETRVGAQREPQTGVVVAQGAEMELLYPAAGVVEESQTVEEGRLQATDGPRVRGLTGARPVERGRHLRVRPGLGKDLLEAVVRGSAPHG